MKVAVTGVSGFIGGQVALHFSRAGHKVLGIDIRPCSDVIANACDKFVLADFGDHGALNAVREYQPHAILHLAASSLVGPSMYDPMGYFYHNVVQTKRLLDVWCCDLRSTKMIFSSSSSVYGEPKSVPCFENQTPSPMSPYGQSKFMGEMMIQSYAQAYNLSAVMFRYFNVCGADPQGQHGQEPGATHIIARILESLRDGTVFTLNGKDYETPDGSCIRDHVHVQDVARLHEMACDQKFAPGIYNVGMEQGASNLEIINLAQEITGTMIKWITGPRRAGDPSHLLSSSSKLQNQGWQPEYTLRDMIQHAWQWYQKQ